MVELIGLMAISAALIVSGNALRGHRAGRALIAAGLAVAACVAALAVLAPALLALALSAD